MLRTAWIESMGIQPPFMGLFSMTQPFSKRGKLVTLDPIASVPIMPASAYGALRTMRPPLLSPATTVPETGPTISSGKAEAKPTPDQMPITQTTATNSASRGYMDFMLCLQIHTILGRLNHVRMLDNSIGKKPPF
jgi:hypothetical protein